MKRPRTPLAFLIAAIAAFLLMPAGLAVAEEEVLPPSNSAAAQYTEAFPTSGGDKKTDQAAHHRSPLKVLGSQKTKELEDQGPAGKAAAEVAASTAPTSIATPPHENTSSTPNNDGGANTANEGGHGKASGDRGSSGPERQAATPDNTGTDSSPVSDQTGSSGLGSTLGQATGLSAVGGSGPLLPLIIAATVLWALFYLRRQRQRVE